MQRPGCDAPVWPLHLREISSLSQVSEEAGKHIFRIDAVLKPRKSCEYSNSVVAHPTAEFMDFIAKHNVPFEDAAAARQRDGGDHNCRETPLFSESLERKALGKTRT
jgi:hypothetical protein